MNFRSQLGAVLRSLDVEAPVLGERIGDGFAQDVSADGAPNGESTFTQRFSASPSMS